MRKTIASLLLFACPLLLPAQPYAVRLEKNTVYGTAIDFSGKTDTLRQDVFKPVGDVIPTAHHTKLVTALFGIAGQFYSVVLVGILISKFSSVGEG